MSAGNPLAGSLRPADPRSPDDTPADGELSRRQWRTSGIHRGILSKPPPDARASALRCHASAPGLSPGPAQPLSSEEHTSELQSLMRISYAVFCLQKKL